MVKTDLPQIKDRTLYETLIITGKDGFDIGDTIWDWGVYFECPKTKEEAEGNYYDKLMLLFALNIIVKKYQPDWYTICTVADFICEHRKAFDKFMNEVNVSWAKPSSYKEIDPDDETFFEVYMGTMENLIAGNYPESDYETLYKYLTEEDKL